MKSKKSIRETFRQSVFERDNWTCQICGADQFLNAHHITDRSEMPNGGYIKENGIAVCESCHMKCEKYHLSGGKEWIDGLHPDDLYKKIGSSKEKAIKASIQQL